MKTQALKITSHELLVKGYTLAQAAREVDRSTYHVWAVITGRRQSKPLVAKLLALPDRALKLRRPITTN